jgi:exodeoxyribonuclease I
MAFAFYDLETTGTSPAFDQPLQFAAILTDDAFEEIERVNLRCRMAPHIIPSPWALAVTGVRPAQLVDPALPSLLELTQDIAGLITRWSPAIWTGFNSIRFDEEMLRQAFYQTLQPDIFATQFNGNTRFDVLTALFAVWDRHPDLLEWPVDETGRVRFALDRISPLNGFADHEAHDALGDVAATIHVTRKIARGAPALWAELLANRDKAHVQARLATFQPMALVERFGGGMPRATLGCFCGYSADNPNQAGFFDLEAADPADWLNVDDAALFAAVDAAPKIIRTLSVNKSPALLAIPVPSDESLARAEVIADAPEFRARVARAVAARFPKNPAAPAPPVEKQIFGGFYSQSDKALLAEFQRADWRRRQEIAAALTDPRLRQLGRRLVALYAPELLSPAEHTQYETWLRARWAAPDGPETEWMTRDAAQRALAELRADGAVHEALIAEIAAYLQRFDPPEG